MIKFKGFSKTRNECIARSFKNYEWTMFIDDSYKLHGSLDELSSLNPSQKCVSIDIVRNQFKYRSKRIFRTNSGLKFVGEIHEVINSNEDYIMKDCYIEDIPCENHKKRTASRSVYDLEQINKQLSNCVDARSLYFKANIITQMIEQKLKTYDDAINAYNERVLFPSDDNEETFMCLINIGHITLQKEHTEEIYVSAIKSYIRAAITFPNRAGEAYIYAYMVSDNFWHVKKAYENKILKTHRLPSEEHIYGPDGSISTNYHLRLKRNVLDQMTRIFEKSLQLYQPS